MKKLIIGFGGVGLNFLQGQKELLGEHFALVAMSDDAKTLECCNVQNKLSIESDFEELDKYLIIAKSIVILNGLGGGSSKSLLPLILYMKKKYDLEIQVILIKPFSWEARLKKELADEVICQLDQIGIKYKIYDNNELLEITQDGMQVQEAFRQMDKKICEYILADKCKINVINQNSCCICFVYCYKDDAMNRVYYRLLARILLYKFNKYSFQGRQKKLLKKGLCVQL